MRKVGSRKRRGGLAMSNLRQFLFIILLFLFLFGLYASFMYGQAYECGQHGGTKYAQGCVNFSFDKLPLCRRDPNRVMIDSQMMPLFYNVT